jgi:hypothetical protein
MLDYSISIECKNDRPAVKNLANFILNEPDIIKYYYNKLNKYIKYDYKEQHAAEAAVIDTVIDGANMKITCKYTNKFKFAELKKIFGYIQKEGIIQSNISNFQIVYELDEDYFTFTRGDINMISIFNKNIYTYLNIPQDMVTVAPARYLSELVTENSFIGIEYISDSEPTDIFILDSGIYSIINGELYEALIIIDPEKQIILDDKKIHYYDEGFNVPESIIKKFFSDTN